LITLNHTQGAGDRCQKFKSEIRFQNLNKLKILEAAPNNLRMYNCAHHNGQATVLKLRRGLKTEALNLKERTTAKPPNDPHTRSSEDLSAKKTCSPHIRQTTAQRRLLHFLFTISKTSTSNSEARPQIRDIP